MNFQIKLLLLVIIQTGMVTVLLGRERVNGLNSVYQDTIYLDPVNASENGSGKTPCDPAVKLPPGTVVKPGLVILYKRGITVRGPFEYFSGTTLHPVTIGAYGKGEKPLFLGSVRIDEQDGFEHNTCIDAGMGWGYETEGRPRLSEFLPDTIGWHIFLDSNVMSGSSIFIRKNIFYNAPQNKLLKVNKLPHEGWPGVVLDYNCYFQEDPNDAIAQVLDKIYYSRDFEDYRKTTGKDRHSIIANPLFVDPEKKDFRLQQNSPCLDKGLISGAEKDFHGKERYSGTAPDMVAFEYITSDSPFTP